MTTIRVFKYGLRPPTENADLVRQQMYAAHQYHNDLIAIERARRTAIREIESAAGNVPELAQAAKLADEQLTKKIVEIKAARAGTRSKSESSEDRAEVRRLRNVRGDARRALQAARKAIRTDPAIIAAKDAVQERAGELKRGARAICGVYWGTYLLEEDAVQAAAKVPLWDGTEPNDPRFQRWCRDGAVGVQLQGGLLSSAVFGQDTQLRIDPVPELAWHSPALGERRRLSRTRLHMRVGSTETGKPVWASWPMIMHRPLPEGSVIKRATVIHRMIGPRSEWTVDITVEVPEEHRPTRPADGAVAIDVGWRLISGELRVATWAATDGQKGELRLSEVLLRRLAHPNQLRSTRDTGFEKAKADLIEWLKDREVPEWLARTAQRLPMWRSAERLANVAQAWRSRRFDGDEDGYGPLEAWRYHDHHLWEWESSERVKTIRRRRDLYRCFAAELSQRYRTVVLEAFDLREMAELPELGTKDEEKTPNLTARANRQLASVSQLRTCLTQAFAETVTVDPNGTTSMHHTCGHVQSFDRNLIHAVCDRCGQSFDQDENAAENILQRFSVERSGGDVIQVGARAADPAEQKPSRWERARTMREEKIARARTSRRQAANEA